RDKGRIVGRQRRLCRVQPVGEYLVQTEIGHEDETIVVGKHDGVRVRAALPARIRSGSAMLHLTGALAEAAVGADPEGNRAAAASAHGVSQSNAASISGGILRIVFPLISSEGILPEELLDFFLRLN